MNAHALLQHLQSQSSNLGALLDGSSDSEVAELVDELKLEADRHWWIDANRSLEFADLIMQIGRVHNNLRHLGLGMMARGDALNYIGRQHEAWELLEQAGATFLQAGDEVGWARTRIGRLNMCVDLNHVGQALAEAAAAREIAVESRARVTALTKDPKTRDQALRLYTTETSDLLDQYIAPFDKLKEFQQAKFVQSSEESEHVYASGRNLILGASGMAVAFGVLLAFLLARSIVRPLGTAVAIADSVKAGKLDNVIDASGRDELARFLGSLEDMQSALRARDQKDADYRGQIAAINRAQAVIEFGMDGMVRDVNENFARVMGSTAMPASTSSSSGDKSKNMDSTFRDLASCSERAVPWCASDRVVFGSYQL